MFGAHPAKMAAVHTSSTQHAYHHPASTPDIHAIDLMNPFRPTYVSCLAPVLCMSWEDSVYQNPCQELEEILRGEKVEWTDVAHIS